MRSFAVTWVQSATKNSPRAAGKRRPGPRLANPDPFGPHSAGSAVRSRNDLILENLLLHKQLQVALRSKRRLRLQRHDRHFWVLVWRLHSNWRRHLIFVRPETVVRWHRRGWRWYWQWRSRTRLGRPRLPAKVRALIMRMAAENPLWGTERIRGELLKLGLVVSARSIRRSPTADEPSPESELAHVPG